MPCRVSPNRAAITPASPPAATVQKVRNRAPNTSAPAAAAGCHASEPPAFSQAYETPGTCAAAHSNPVQQAANASGRGQRRCRSATAAMQAIPASIPRSTTMSR